MRTHVDRLRALVDVALMQAGDESLEDLLAAVARSVARSLAFRCVVVNLYRPAWDDFECAVVHGPADARDALLGATMGWDQWEPLLDERFRCHGAYLLPHEEFTWPEDEASFTPDFAPGPEPDAWHPEDALFVPMHDASGRIVGILSVDDPESRRRPSDEDLEVLSAVAAHAAHAVVAAQNLSREARHRSAVDHLLKVSAQIAGQESFETILDAVCRGVQEALGFERVAVFLGERGEDRLTARAQAGWGGLDDLGPGLSRRALAPLLKPEYERDGCFLATREEAAARLPPDQILYASSCNGRGPRAWNRHWLTVPLHAPDGQLVGIIWPDDPSNRLLPTRGKLRALRVFANQAVSALEAAKQMERLRHLAEHDPLTGLRNRRDLGRDIDAAISDAQEPVSLLLCDLDHFKRVNDRHGHEAGDRALVRFAELLRAHATLRDTPVRLGGEEFALVLRGAGAERAWATAEELRRSMCRFFAEDLPDLRVSIGIATTGEHAADAEELLSHADTSLYAAKRLGRDRSVAYDPDLARRVLEAGPQSAGEQLAAVVMLAETLDMRDPHTARHSETVGRYARRIVQRLGWEEERVERMRIAGVLHDVGKIGVPDTVLLKAGPLDALERAEMERHCELGAQILSGANLPDVAAWVAAHHERMDGAGYPRGLDGEDIPVEARVLAVADAFEAMTAGRPYQAARSEADARAELCACAGTQFDSDVVAAFLEVLGAESVPPLPLAPVR